MPNKREDELDPPPVVSHRLELPSVTEFVDEAMARMPESVVLNMSDHQQRNHLRSWVTVLLEHFLSQTVWAFQKGADRGIAQIADLIRDPSYYQTLKTRRARAREATKRMMEQSDAQSAQWRREAALALKAEVDAGKVRLFHGQMLDVAALPDDERGPQLSPDDDAS